MKETEEKSMDRLYEEEIKPVIENLDKDPFRSTHVAEATGHPSTFCGRILTQASEEDSYEIEKIDVHPGKYSVEGNTLDHGINFYREEEQMRDSVLEYLEEEGEIDQTEISKIVSEELENASTVSRASKVGKLTDYLKSEETVTYDGDRIVFVKED
ncbi:MAG: hypothetical protein BRC29_01495 [Nanohaloarchaea archaeon SW_7_43_1]|nr:MAG: hypothetical protein BRC29_01495 [Nanohaloarchaea archaeon SW_7_43_1]